LAVAGCATIHSRTGAKAASRTAASATPRQRAVAEAAAILKAFVVPSGGKRLLKAPAALKVPITTLGSTTLVDDVSFWRAAGQPHGGTGLGPCAPAPPIQTGRRRFRASVMGPHVLARSDSRRAERPGAGGRSDRSGQGADGDPSGRAGELAAAPTGLGAGTF